MKPTPTESASMSRRQFVAASAVAAGGGVAALLTRDATASAGAGVAADMTPVSVEDVIESRSGDYGIVVLTDGDGRYILHNDNLWNPNRDQRFYSRDWTRVDSGASRKSRWTSSIR